MRDKKLNKDKRIQLQTAEPGNASLEINTLNKNVLQFITIEKLSPHSHKSCLFCIFLPNC